MEINKLNLSTEKSSNSQKKIATEKSVVDVKASEKETVAKKEQVSFTAEAKKISNIQQNLAASDAIDLEKVTKIKQAIADGTYKINKERLAENIANFEHSFDEE